jgi:predicted DsbA family dithiol-disulfide isomerase
VRVAFVIAILAACQNPSALDRAPNGEAKPAPPPSPSNPTPRAAPGASDDLATRLARVERRLAKVTATIDQMLPPPDPDPVATYAVAIDPLDPVRGPADARVTIVAVCELLDPGCYVAAGTLDDVAAKYPRDVRVVTKYLLARGQISLASGQAMCAANAQGKTRELARALRKRYFVVEGGVPRLASERVTGEAIDAAAAEVGLDVARLHDDMAASSCNEWLRRTAQQMHALGGIGLPAAFVNGRFLGGAQPIESFDATIAQERERADAAIAGGVPAAEYYAREIVGKGLARVKGRFEE